VYNLEVHAEHAYHVSRVGLLVHNNACGKYGGFPHQHKARQLMARLKARGWRRMAGPKPLGEKGYRMLAGTLRFPDVVMEKGGDLIALQVGRRTILRKLPVWRERKPLKQFRECGIFKHVFFAGY